MRCPRCNSLKTQKNGVKILKTGNRTQEFKCRGCSRYFSIQVDVNVLHELKYVEPGDILEVSAKKEIRIHGLTDVHVGAVEHDFKKFEEAIKMIEEDDDAKWFGNGDLLELIPPHYKINQRGQDIPPEEQYLEFARLVEPIKFINTDTCLEASLNSYALSKSQFAHWGRLIANKKSSNLTFLNIRLQQFYGPGDDKTKLPGHILHSCFSNVTNLKLTSGNQLRDFIYIEDVIAAFLVVVKNIESFEQYSEIELGTGNSITVKEFVQTVHSLLGSSTNLLFGAIPSRDNEPEECVADLNVLLGLGWEPNFSLVDGLTKTIKLEFNRGQMI